MTLCVWSVDKIITKKVFFIAMSLWCLIFFGIALYFIIANLMGKLLKYIQNHLKFIKYSKFYTNNLIILFYSQIYVLKYSSCQVLEYILTTCSTKVLGEIWFGRTSMPFKPLYKNLLKKVLKKTLSFEDFQNF